MVIESCIKIHSKIGPGCFEKVYQEILYYQLCLKGLLVHRQTFLPIEYESLHIENAFKLDLLIENKLVLEIKSVHPLPSAYFKQLKTQLGLLNLKHGMILNFKEDLMKNGIHRFLIILVTKNRKNCMLMPHILHLSKDKKLAKILLPQDKCVLQKRKNVHLHICSSIMSQQLSTKVAAVIYGRFLELFNKKNPTPGDIIALDFDTLRAIGLSNAKTKYVFNVCEFFIEQKLIDARLHKMDDEELIEFLTQIKGVGRWTAEMILMFTLGREDVFAVDDLGIQQAMIKLYNLDASDKRVLKQKMISLSAKWKPYRTYACRYLWGWKDGSKK